MVPPCNTAGRVVVPGTTVVQHSMQQKKSTNTRPMNPQCVYVCTIRVTDLEPIDPANQMASWRRGER